MKDTQKIISEFDRFKYELGEVYLEKIKSGLGSMQSEVIIAIENIKNSCAKY